MEAHLSSLAYTLYRVRRTALQMCHDRGYLVTQSELDLTFEEFRAQHGIVDNDSNINRNDLIILVAHRSDPTDQMFVFFIDERRFGVKNILTYSSQMQEQHVKNAILVFQQGLTNAAKQAITELDSQFNFEFFTEKDLIINITDHCLQPKFRLMTAEEKKSICQK